MIGVVASAVVSIIVTVTVVIKTGMDILSVIVTVTVVIVSAVAANIVEPIGQWVIENIIKPVAQWLINNMVTLTPVEQWLGYSFHYTCKAATLRI